MKRVRQGNYFELTWELNRQDMPELISNATNFSLTLYKVVFGRNPYEVPYSIINGNTIKIGFTTDIADRCGNYYLKVSYDLAGREVKRDIAAVQIVPRTFQSDDVSNIHIVTNLAAVDTSVEIVSPPNVGAESVAIKKIRKGNGFPFDWQITRSGNPENFVGARSRKLYQYRGKFGDNKSEITQYNLDYENGVITIDVTPELANKTGIYYYELCYRIDDAQLEAGERDCVTDITAFHIVGRTSQADELYRINATHVGGGMVNIVHSTSNERATDYSVFSSLRSLMEISKAISEAFSGVDFTSYLSKVKNDVAEGFIKFMNGISVKKLAVFHGGIEVGQFVSGMFAGKGARIDSAGNAELESMVLRSFLEVPTIRYNELEYIGEEIIIGAGAVLKGVEHLGDDRYRLTLKLEDGQFNPFRPSDLLKGIYNMDEDGNFTGLGTTYVSVSSIDEHDEHEMIVILADESDVVGDTNMPPRKFMHLARIGNFTDTDRQSYISLSAKDRAITQYGGVNAFAKKNKQGLNVRAGAVTTQWGRAEGLEFIENFENLPITKDSDVLYTDTLLYNKQIKVDYEGIVIKEYIDRGQWIEGMECQITETTIDEVWHEAEKFRLIDRPIVDDPFVTTEKPTRESADWMLILSIKDDIGGHAPIIRNGYWYEWNPTSTEEDKYENTGVRAEGKDGTDGEDALVGFLTNENITLQASSDGTVGSFATATGTFELYEGLTKVTTGKTYQRGVQTNCTVTIDPATGVYSVTSMSADNASVPFTVFYKSAAIVKILTLSKSRAGSSAPLLVISESAQIMICNDDNVPQSNQTIEIEAKLQNVTGTNPATFLAVAYNEYGGEIGNLTLGGSGNVRTLTSYQWLSTYKKVVINVSLGTLTDVTTIHRLTKPKDGDNGKDALVGFLTNENITVQASATGVVGPLDTAIGYFRLYSGVTPVTSGRTFSVVGTPVGCTVTMNSSTGYYTVQSMSADNASATFRVTYGTVTIDKVLTLSKSKAGEDGFNNATVYLYKRYTGIKANIPMPLETLSYTFSTELLTGNMNGWTTAIPVGEDQLYIIGATASSREATDDIPPHEWSGATELGSSGFNSATITLYQRKASKPSKPTSNCTYTFSTGELTNITQDWLEDVPTGNEKLWVTKATAIATTATDIIESSEWADPTVMAKDGNDVYSVSLSKENHTYSYDKNNNLKGFLSDGATAISVQRGDILFKCDVTSIGIPPVTNNTYRVIAIAVDGVSYSGTTMDIVNNEFKVWLSAFTGETGSMTFTIRALSDGVFSKDFKKTISFSKNRDGDDGLPPEVDETITQYALGDSKVEHPLESSANWGASIQPPTELLPYQWSRQKITYKNSTQVIYVGYVLITNISPASYMFGEWDMRVAFKRDDISYPIVTYLRAGDKPLYYYPKKEGTIKYDQFVAYTNYSLNDIVWYENDGAGGGTVVPLGLFRSKFNNNNYYNPSFESWWENVTAKYAPNGVEGGKLWAFVDGMELIITEALMANFAKLDSFVFHKGKMFSQEGTLRGVAGSTEYTDADHEPNFEADGRSGKVKMKDAEIEGKITATSGKIGNWNIVGGGLYSDYSTIASIRIEQSGGKFLRINDSIAGPMLAIRADNSTALSIYTQGGVGGVGIYVAAQTGATAIQSFGSHSFIQRNTEKWNAPGVLMIAQRVLNSLSGVSNVYNQKWMIEPLKNTFIYREGRNIELRHNIGHVDYVAYILINAGAAEIDSVSHTSEKSTFYISGTYSEGHEITIVMIGRNKI